MNVVVDFLGIVRELLELGEVSIVPANGGTAACVPAGPPVIGYHLPAREAVGLLPRAAVGAVASYVFRKTKRWAGTPVGEIARQLFERDAGDEEEGGARPRRLARQVKIAGRSVRLWLIDEARLLVRSHDRAPGSL